MSHKLPKPPIFTTHCAAAQKALAGAKNVQMPSVERAVKTFMGKTNHAARVFEIILHSFMQAMVDSGYSLGFGKNDLSPLTQMRSANKKHGNVGDVEIKSGNDISEAWDAKYKKPYLFDELKELEDKLSYSPRVITAGFVVDTQPDTRDAKINQKISDIATEYNTDVRLLSLHGWIDYEVGINNVANQDVLAEAWLKALVESLTLQRKKMAPIDEPCDEWVVDLTKVIKQVFK